MFIWLNRTREYIPAPVTRPNMQLAILDFHRTPSKVHEIFSFSCEILWNNKSIMFNSRLIDLNLLLWWTGAWLSCLGRHSWLRLSEFLVRVIRLNSFMEVYGCVVLGKGGLDVDFRERLLIGNYAWHFNYWFKCN